MTKFNIFYIKIFILCYISNDKSFTPKIRIAQKITTIIFKTIKKGTKVIVLNNTKLMLIISPKAPIRVNCHPLIIFPI